MIAVIKLLLDFSFTELLFACLKSECGDSYYQGYHDTLNISQIKSIHLTKLIKKYFERQ